MICRQDYKEHHKSYMLSIAIAILWYNYLQKIGGSKMKKRKLSIQNHVDVMAKVAMAFSEMSANSRCICIYHQPKMPVGLQKLKKN